jgi:hypothetical protein
MKGRVSSSLLLVLALVAFGSSNSPVVMAQDTTSDPLGSLEQFVGPLLEELTALINATDIDGIIEGLTSGDLGNVNITETLETLGDGLQDILGGLGLNFTNILDGGLGDLLQGLNLNISQILDEVDLGDLGIDRLDDLDIGQVVNGALSCNWTQLTPQIDACVSSINDDDICTTECTSFYETLQKECPALIDPLSAILPADTCGLTPPTTDTTPVVPSTDTTPDVSPAPTSGDNGGITKGEEDGTVPQTSSATMVSAGMIVATLGSILVSVA